MLIDLPTFIEPQQLAKHHSRLTGQMAVQHLLRLRDSLSEVRGNISVDWQFSLIEHNCIKIEGYINALLPVICQRCLLPMDMAIGLPVALTLLPVGHTENDLPDGYEVITLTNTSISLISLIEDELILGLPIAPKHLNCPSNEYILASNSVQESDDKSNPEMAQRYYPFQDLSRWQK